MGELRLRYVDKGTDDWGELPTSLLAGVTKQRPRFLIRALSGDEGYLKYGDKAFRPARQGQPHSHHTFITYTTTTA